MTETMDTGRIASSILGSLNELNKYIVSYLESVLPTISPNWWNESVMDSLSFQQKKRIEQSGNRSLSSLDLAALLKVLDQNWYDISTKLNLPSEARHFVKEMQTIRNRWAHTGMEGFPVDDVYRDFDTLQRFASVIQADDCFIRDIREQKISLINREKMTSQLNPNIQPSLSDSNNNGHEFKPGQMVCLKSNPETRGAVISVVPGNPENRYLIFANNETLTLYASQIQSVNQQNDSFEFLSCEQFHAYMTALQIKNPNLSTLYSLNAARIDFIPYQFRPVLKFIRSDRPRLLVADGVGVGKTIEAGLILRELQARRDVRSVLIICPRPLVTEKKWLNEMKRFEERFTHLDGSTLRFCINEMDLDGVWPEQHQKAIVPYSLFDEDLLCGTGGNKKKKRTKGLLDLDPPPRFDFVIVDEAHHIRNQNTYSHKAVRFFCDHAEAVVFLTATPIQMGSDDLFTLLNTLRPDLIIDRESFAHMAEPNPFINRAVALVRAQQFNWIKEASLELEKAAKTPWGQAIFRQNPEFLAVQNLLVNGPIAPEERVQLISDLEALHTFAGIINRTRRRDIGDFTTRKPETVEVDFTPSQKELHDTLLGLQAQILSLVHEDVNVKFMLTTIRRQAASCLYGLIPFLNEILHRHLDELSWVEMDDSQSLPQVSLSEAIEMKIQVLLKKAQSLDSLDPKLEALQRIIQDKQNLLNNKIMLFSSFRHTLQYLYEKLFVSGIRVGMIHGDIPDEERIVLRNRFEQRREEEGSLDVLLFSEIGCEGLDYQFCDCIVNYDLPWNPMRVEQRIGRIDRNGQKSESVAIYNLITPGTVDADIYDRCLVRIGVFNHALGECEEILGQVTQEIRNIVENLTLSEEERRNKLQQLADNKIRLIQEQEELERRQVDLFGIGLPEEQMKKDVEDASSFWLSPESIYRLIVRYIRLVCGEEQEYILGEKPLKTLRLSQESRTVLLRDFQKLPRQNSTVNRDWEYWLKGGDPYLTITFESECALQNPKAVFITPLHPLARQAAISQGSSKRVFTSLQVKTNTVPCGHYEFAFYQWQFCGIREDLILRPVSFSEPVTRNLSDLLKYTLESERVNENVLDSTIWDQLDASHHKLWREAQERHKQKTLELAKYRRESLIISHRARLSLLEEQLHQATNEKIKKMRHSQIQAAEADYARRIQELDIAVERADIVAKPVAYGVIHVSGGLI